MIPLWLTTLAWISLILGVASALVVSLDLRRHPQPMSIMNVVWPLCALAGHVLVLYFYWRCARTTHAEAHHDHHHSSQPMAVKIGKSTLHCGAGCTAGDIIAEALVGLFPAIAIVFGWHLLFQNPIFAIWILDFILALAFGILFQYLAIKPMSQQSTTAALKAAAKADFLSLSAWQVGMYGFMAIAHFWIFSHLLQAPLNAAQPSFWLMMQLAMICGFITAYPVNGWLIKRGIKHAM